MLRTARSFWPDHPRKAPYHCRVLLLTCVPLLVFYVGAAAWSQTRHSEPVTDSAAQSSPVQRPPNERPTDASLMASPALGPGIAGGPSIPAHTQIPVRLGRAIDSGHLHNGDTIPATLTAPVRLSNGSHLPAGTPVQLSVIETLPAGALNAFGELSLQVEKVGRTGVLSNIKTWRGKPGHRDVPDAAAAVGTDARLARGAQVVFTVPPLAVPTSVSSPHTGTAH